MKKTRSFRINPDILEKLKSLGIDPNEIVEAALAKAVGDKRCPYCSQKIKGGKK